MIHRARDARRRLLPALVLTALVPQLTFAEPTIREAKFELFVTDVVREAAFYRALGFEVAAQKPDGYTTMRQGKTVVALSPVPWWLPLRWLWFLRSPPLGTEIVLYSDRLAEVRDALLSAGYAPGEIQRQSWGDRDFRVHDYEGYYVRISEGVAVRTRAESR